MTNNRPDELRGDTIIYQFRKDEVLFRHEYLQTRMADLRCYCGNRYCLTPERFSIVEVATCDGEWGVACECGATYYPTKLVSPLADTTLAAIRDAGAKLAGSLTIDGHQYLVFVAVGVSTAHMASLPVPVQWQHDVLRECWHSPQESLIVTHKGHFLGLMIAEGAAGYEFLLERLR